MLILQRKKNESLVIGENIKITIVDAGNDCVKLAIDAPKDITIVRSELLEAASINQEASTPDTSSVMLLQQLLHQTSTKASKNSQKNET